MRAIIQGRGWRDVVLAGFVVQWSALGLWATLAPQSFYDEFPGGGRQWISLDGPFNEHLIRDVGALWLALATVSGLALWQRLPALVRAAGAAVTVFSIPHVTYHALNTDPFGTGDVVASVGGLLFGLVLGVVLVISPGESAAG